MKHFMTDFMNSPYFFRYVISESELYENVIGIYVAGSACLGIEDEYSDYDIVILCVKPLPHRKFFEEYIRLKYKGRPIHGYYDSLDYLFSTQDCTNTNILGKVHFSNWFRITTIYENPRYSDLLLKLDTIKTNISICASYAFLDYQRPLITKIIAQNSILKEDYNKIIYQCCYACCLLTKTPLNVECLGEIKRIYGSPVKAEYKELAIQLLKKGIDFIDNYPIDYREELTKLYGKVH